MSKYKKNMNHDNRGVGISSGPLKRKRGVHHHRVRPKKSTVCQAVFANQLDNTGGVADVALDPLREPNFDEGKPAKPRRRYYTLSIAKMVRLVGQQTNFLCQFLHLPNWKSPCASNFKTLSHHIGVCKADPTSSHLAFFYLATLTLRGTCVAKGKHRKCVVLGMEYRQEAPSFRLYMAYFSPTRYYAVCYVRFLIKRLLYRWCVDSRLAQLIMEFCFHGLMKKGFEIVGAHYMHPKKAKGKPQFCMAKSKHTRHFTSMWDDRLKGTAQDGINFLIKHARRDVQVFDLRIESKMYMNLICGKM